MASGEPNHNLIIHYKMKRYTIGEVNSDGYSHMEMLYDVSELALKDVPSNVNIYVTLNLPVPGSADTMELRTDTDMRSMFELYQRTENIHILLKVSENPPLVANPPETRKQLQEDGGSDAQPVRQPNWISLDRVRGKGKGKRTVAPAAPELAEEQEERRQRLRQERELYTNIQFRRSTDRKLRLFWKDEGRSDHHDMILCNRAAQWDRTHRLQMIDGHEETTFMGRTCVYVLSDEGVFVPQRQPEEPVAQPRPEPQPEKQPQEEEAASEDDSDERAMFCLPTD